MNLTNGLNMWEMGVYIWERAMNLTNGLNMWEITYISGKGLKYLRND